jgi:hypothetical protein
MSSDSNEISAAEAGFGRVRMVLVGTSTRATSVRRRAR